MIEINSTATLGKSLSVKREKVGDEGERVIAHLKFAETFVDRDVIDDLCGRPIGWARMSLFDEMGAPVALLELGLPTREWQAAGGVSDPSGASLPLGRATLSAVTLALTPLGALLSGQLSWQARGDEVEDLTDMLGREVTIVLSLNDGGQQDLLEQLRAGGVTSMTIQRPGQEPVEIIGGKEAKIQRADDLLVILHQGGTVQVNAGGGYTVTTKAGKRIDVWNNAVTALLRRGVLATGLAGQLSFTGHSEAA